MSAALEVYEITNPMDPILLGSIAGEMMYIGREPGSGGLTVPNQAISRQHGQFITFEGHLFYRDLGSTNGSWCNGFTVTAGQTRYIRAGDVLQLANTAIRIGKEATQGSHDLNALFVLHGNDFVELIKIPSSGRALVIGGAEAKYKVEGAAEDLPALVVERKADGLSAYSLSKTVKASLNGRIVSDAVSVRDGDELKVGEYTILTCDSTSKRKADLGPAKELLDMSHTSLIGSQQHLSGARSSSASDWSRPAGEPTETTIAFDPKIAQKFQTRLGDSHQSFRGSGTGHQAVKLPRPTPGSLEAWLAGFTIICLLLAFGVFLYIVLFT